MLSRAVARERGTLSVYFENSWLSAGAGVGSHARGPRSRMAACTATSGMAPCTAEQMSEWATCPR